jgi:hypothetical protein
MLRAGTSLGATGGSITALCTDARRIYERKGEAHDRTRGASRGLRGDEGQESATAGAVEEEEKTGGPGGTKDNVSDEWDESQRR